MWSLDSLILVLWNILIFVTIYTGKEERAKGKEAGKVWKQSRIERMGYEMVKILIESWLSFKIGNACTFPLLSSRAPSKIRAPFLRSPLPQKTHYVWRPSNRGDTQCIFSIWFRSDFGYFLPGSTLLQRFGTRKTSCYKDIASPEATSACNFRLQHILIGFHLIWSQVGVWTPRIWSQPCHSSPPEILVSTLFFSLL